MISAPTEESRRHACGGVCRLKKEKEVPNGGITGWFGALFECRVSVRVSLNGLTEFELAWCWYLLKGRPGCRPSFVRQETME